MNYIALKYDHLVYKSFEYKDKAKGFNLLKKPRALMIKKIIQVASLGDNTILAGKEVNVIE